MCYVLSHKSILIIQYWILTMCTLYLMAWKSIGSDMNISSQLILITSFWGGYIVFNRCENWGLDILRNCPKSAKMNWIQDLDSDLSDCQTQILMALLYLIHIWIKHSNALLLRDLWTSNITTITWELGRNAESQVPPYIRSAF